MFLQTQAWSSCFKVFNQGSRILWAEWEQGNVRLLLVVPLTSFSPARLWKQPWPCCISQQQFSAEKERVEGAAGLSLSQPTAGQACRHSRAAVQTPHTLPSHKPRVRTTTKSDTWQKGLPHASAFNHPKAGHSCSGTSQYLLVSPKSFLQTSHNYMEAHLSFKTTVWGLHGNPDMWTLHAHQEPDRSKNLQVSYCYCFPSSNLLASEFSNTAQNLKAQDSPFLPSRLEAVIWLTPKSEEIRSILAGLLRSNHCCPAELTLFQCGSTAVTNSRLHTMNVQAKSKISTASEKQTAPVAPDRIDFCFLWVAAEGFSTFTDQAIHSIIWSLLLALYLQFFKEIPLWGRTHWWQSIPPSTIPIPQELSCLYQKHPGAPRWERKCTEAQSGLGL